jgi:competence protein ComEA
LQEFSVLRAAVAVEPVEVQPAWVDLNRATATQLEQLSGIGQKMAKRIVEYRRASGPFASVDDLVQVRGIGAVTLKKLRPLLRVQ